MKKNIFVLSALILSSCSQNTSHSSIAYEMMFNFSDTLKKSDGFKLDLYGGEMADGVKTISLDYSAEKYLNVDETRKLAITISQKLIKYYNNEISIQPYLFEHPFTEKNIELSLHFESKRGWIYEGDYVSTVRVMNSKIFYSRYNPQTDKFDRIFVESYSDGLKMVQENSIQK